MNKLKKLGGKFRSRFTTIEGSDFFGQILQPPDTARVSNFLSARRYLRVDPDCFLQPGAVVICAGAKYIIAEHGDGFFNTPIYRHFKMFAVDWELPWIGSTSAMDTVTGVYKETKNVAKGTAYISIQPGYSTVDAAIGIPNEQHVFVCDKQPALGDLIGNYFVQKVDLQLGIAVVGVRKK